MSSSNIRRIDVYQDKDAGWRWRAVAGNNEPVAWGESHTRPEDAVRAAVGVFGQETLDALGIVPQIVQTL